MKQTDKRLAPSKLGGQVTSIHRTAERVSLLVISYARGHVERSTYSLRPPLADYVENLLKTASKAFKAAELVPAANPPQ